MDAAFALRLTRSQYLALPEEDRAWHEAYLAEERDRHEPCGQQLSETLDPKNIGRWTATEAGQCQACMVIRAKSEDTPPDVLWTAHLRHD